jgi:hypothetical protein
MEHLELFPKKLAKLVKFTPLKKKISQKFPIFFLGPKNDKICFLKMTVPFHSIPLHKKNLNCFMHSSTNHQRMHQKAQNSWKKTPQQFENQTITCEFKVVEFPHVPTYLYIDVAWKP